MIRAFLFAVVVSLALVTVVSADDVVVNPGVARFNDNGIVWITPNTGYLVYSDPTTPRLAWIKTVDGGTTWSSPVSIQTSCDVGPLAIWFDKWTKGDTGTTIHISWHRQSNTGNPCGGNVINYTSLNTATDVLGGIVTSSISGYTGICASGQNRCIMSMTKSRGGNLYIYANIAQSGDNRKFLISVNNGSTWSTGSLGVGGTAFIGALAPFNADNDILIGDGIDVPQDIVAFDYSLGQYLLYDFSAGTWIDGGIISNPDIPCVFIGGESRRCFTRASNPTPAAISPTGTGGVFFGQLSKQTTDSCLTGGSLCDFRVYKMTTAGIMSEVTPVFTGRNSITTIHLTFDSTSNDLYAVYIDQTLDVVLYRKSSNYGTTWGPETRFDDTVNNKVDGLMTPNVGFGGGRFMPVWAETPALVTNLDGVIIFVGDADEGTDQDFENRLDRFVSGMGFRGTSGGFWFASLTSMFLAGMMMLFRAPIMVTAAVVGMWSTLMTLVGFLPFGVYLSAVTVFGIILIFLILKTMQGSEGDL